MPETNPVESMRLSSEMVRELDADTVARVLTAASDVAMIIDADGTISDIAIAQPDEGIAALSHHVRQSWVDTLSSESRSKGEALLHDAYGGANPRWREINHETQGGSIPIRYVAMGLGHEGRVIALGRDLRQEAELQQRLMQAQQAMEREYVRLRQAESRYRLLFQISSEPLMIVDPSNRRIVEANPAVGSLFGVASETLVGQPFGRSFHADSRDRAGAFIMEANGSGRAAVENLRLADIDQRVSATASLFRQNGGVHVLVRLRDLRADEATGAEGKTKLLAVLERMPEAFVLVDQDFSIVEANGAFLELAHLPGAEAARGQSLRRFIGRSAGDLKVLQSNLRDHGWVRNFGTVFNSAFGLREEVELSAVSVDDDNETYCGLVLRPMRRQPIEQLPTGAEFPRTAEQLKELVGRASLRDIVRETTDVIERMCIEAALGLTGNNRAMAAEMLGLSRQSLYSKLDRYGLSDSEQEASSHN